MKRFFILTPAFIAWSALFSGAISCGNMNASSGGNATAPLQTISVDGFKFSPVILNAKPGEVIRVVNNDKSTHTVTSESAPNAFDDNGDFDSNELGGGQEGTITIPADAGVGGDLFFYCDIHKADMDTPNGTIHVIAP